MQQRSKNIMADICKEYLKVAQDRKFEFYRSFSSVPSDLYSKYQGKLSNNEIEVRYAVKHLKVREVIAIKYYGDYRTGFYRTDSSTQANNSDEVIHDLKLSRVFRDILWKRHKMTVEDLEKLLDFESEEMHKKFKERANRQQKEPEQEKQDFIWRHNKKPKINAKDRIRELKVLMQRSHPDKGGTASLFVRYSKELAEIRN